MHSAITAARETRVRRAALGGLPAPPGPAGGGVAGEGPAAPSSAQPSSPGRAPERGFARPRQRGGAWVSVSCKRRDNREIEEFPGTSPGVLRFARRRRGVEDGQTSSVWGPRALWKFQQELGKTGSGKAPPECTCPRPSLGWCSHRRGHRDDARGAMYTGTEGTVRGRVESEE